MKSAASPEPLFNIVRDIPQPDQEGLEALAFVANEDVVIRLGQIARQHPDWTPTILGVLEAIGGPVATKVAAGLMG